MNDAPDEPEHLSPQLQILYRDAIDNIMFLKREQWMITNYLIAALAGVYALVSSLAPVTLFEKGFLTVVVLVAVVYFFLLLNKIWEGMEKFRKRIVWFNENAYGSVLKNELGLEQQSTPTKTDSAFRTCIRAVGIFAALVVLYLLWRETLAALVDCVKQI
ncbi:MAG: hypothetical protein OEO83_10665 [Alphaproteobacteria bacterium]|nr:hypothetical protein [Alphaproteobacteria bacterium]